MLALGFAVGLLQEVQDKLVVPDGLDQLIDELPVANNEMTSPMQIAESLAETLITG